MVTPDGTVMTDFIRPLQLFGLQLSPVLLQKMEVEAFIIPI
jgi:hypothetical protein